VPSRLLGRVTFGAHNTDTSGGKLSRALAARPRLTTMSSTRRYDITHSSLRNPDRRSVQLCKVGQRSKSVQRPRPN
jgi:hypothetical protein